jgi:hypothetical protein
MRNSAQCDQVARLLLTDQVSNRVDDLDRREHHAADDCGERPLDDGPLQGRFA